MPNPPNSDFQTQARVEDAPPYGVGPNALTMPAGSTAAYINGTEAANQPGPNDPSAPGPPILMAVRVYNSVGASIPNATWTTVSFDTVERQVGKLWVASAPTLITFSRQGWFGLAAGVDFTANAVGSRGLRFVRNDGTVLAAERGATAIAGENDMRHTMTQDFFLAGQSVHLEVWQSSGGALSIVTEGRQSPMCSATFFNIQV